MIDGVPAKTFAARRERSRQGLARLAVSAVIAASAGLTVAIVATAGGSGGTAVGANTPAATAPAQGVTSAGLAPSIEPSTTPTPPGATTGSP